MRVAEYVRRARRGVDATAVLARVIGWMVFTALASVIILYVGGMAVMGMGVMGREAGLVVVALSAAVGLTLVGLLWMGVYLWSLAVRALVKYLGSP